MIRIFLLLNLKIYFACMSLNQRKGIGTINGCATMRRISLEDLIVRKSRRGSKALKIAEFSCLGQLGYLVVVDGHSSLLVAYVFA
jgi:hypothetical protein